MEETERKKWKIKKKYEREMKRIEKWWEVTGRKFFLHVYFIVAYARLPFHSYMRFGVRVTTRWLDLQIVGIEKKEKE